MNVLVSLLVKYLESHPDQMVALLNQLVDALINALKQHNASK